MTEITEKTMNALSKMYEINQSLIIKANTKQIKSINQSRTRAAYTNLDVEFERDFAIYDLQELISMFVVIENPVVDLSNEKYAVIKSKDGTNKLIYSDANVNVIDSYFKREFKLKNEEIKVNVKKSDIKKIMKSCEKLSLNFISFFGDGEKSYMKAYATRKGDGKETNSFTIEVGETNHVFNIIYRNKMISMIDDDATFTFANDEDSRISKVECGDMTYWIGIELNSTVGE